jgi:hypothetical protein
MAAQYPGDELADRVVAHVVALEDPSLVSIALDSLPAITRTVADAAARALAAIDSDSSYILDRFRQANQLDALRYLHENARSEMTGAAARRELAAAGDLEAQRAELQTVRDAVGAGSNFRHSSPEWLSAAGVELLPQLEEVLVAVSHRVGPSEWDLGRALASTLERLGDEAAVAIYDRLIADPQAVGGSFYWHQRETLIGEIARRRVLAELPSTPVGVVTLLEDLGYPSRDSG